MEQQTTKPIYRPEMDAKLSKQERIIAFLKNRNATDFIKLNDFLKSLFPLPKINAIPEWKKRDKCKELRGVLEEMVTNGTIQIKNNMHRQLGKFYYPTNDGRTYYYNLETTPMEGKM